GIDNVVRAVGAAAQALLGHSPYVAAPEQAQPKPAQAAPAQFQAHEEAATRLNAGQLFGDGWAARFWFGCRHTLRIANPADAGYGVVGGVELFPSCARARSRSRTPLLRVTLICGARLGGSRAGFVSGGGGGSSGTGVASLGDGWAAADSVLAGSALGSASSVGGP